MPTGYVLEDGSVVDPSEVTQGSDGVLRHESGAAVAMAPHGPRSRGVAKFDAVKVVPKDREMAAEDKPKPRRRTYKTRGA